MNNISPDKVSMHYSLIQKLYAVFLLQLNGQFIYCEGNHAVKYITFLLFQSATEGVERVAYKKLIAPFKKDMPISSLDGLRRVCTDHKYAFVAPKFSITYGLQTLSCQLVMLPETSYPVTTAFIISKSSPYKGFINWR
jgi:hypothetical protein